MDFLKGKRTYAVAAAVGLITIAYQLGWIDGTLYTTALGLLGASGLATLRAGMPKA